MVATIEPFYAVELSKLAHKLAAEGRSIIHMEFGQPATGAPAAAIAAAHRILDNDGMGYWESAALKQRISGLYADRYAVSVDPERVILTCGASPALVLALSCLFEPGDRIAFARPGYVAYRNTAKSLYLDPVELECGPAQRFQLTEAALRALDPQPSGLIIASPANPTGTIIAPEEAEAIAAHCRRHGIAIISDEIYHGLAYGSRARSMLEFAPDALVINSFSKYFSMAGWRLGWLIVPDHLITPARARMGNLFLTPPSLAQHAALAAFDCSDELDAHLATYARNRDLLLKALPELGLNRIAPPDGAFYAYVDISDFTDDSVAFCTQMLLDTGVATAPGVDFDPVDGRHHMRFSFALSTAEVDEALARIRPWFAMRAITAG
ncbi:pyridoxal phosphate-dependent aminotransferase [Rhizorhabdus phycosphaerae]|uniref:pyridoxal phosphate-dependent aminotransferase n=1 Tax=Rhizorhabdus phycosphaerae TaxID=2711156 RepID=UPI0013EC6309|nr:aminotransferase class I/II-fold pyridoxal phosphate-dependent enzyme [Rhizorhabdus phycosphaerae]